MRLYRRHTPVEAVRFLPPPDLKSGSLWDGWRVTIRIDGTPIIPMTAGRIACPGDWIIREPSGDYTILSDPAFRAAYSPAEAAPPIATSAYLCIETHYDDTWIVGVTHDQHAAKSWLAEPSPLRHRRVEFWDLSTPLGTLSSSLDCDSEQEANAAEFWSKSDSAGNTTHRKFKGF